MLIRPGFHACPLPARLHRAATTAAPLEDRLERQAANGAVLRYDQHRLAAEVSLPALPWLPAAATVSSTLHGETLLTFEGLRGGYRPVGTEGDLVVFEPDPVGPQLLVDTSTGAFGLRTRPDEGQDGLTRITMTEIFPAEGGRQIHRDEVRRGLQRAYVEVLESPRGDLTAAEVVNGERTPLKATSVDSQVWHDILLMPAGLGAHLAARGLRGLASWHRQPRSVVGFEPLSQRPGRTFPLLEAQLAGYQVAPPPAFKEPQVSVYSDYLTLRLGETTVEVGGFEVPIEP